MTAPSLNAVPNVGIKLDSENAYRHRLRQLQEQLLAIQQALFRSGQRALVVFEGADASGKGNTIRRITELMDPRSFRVHPIGQPNPVEQGRHYLWRFFRHLPPPGRVAIFDRSWYGRVLVERVEGLASEDQWHRAYREINELERWLVDDGVRLCKFYLSIDRDEQARRFKARLEDPLKSWKLTEEDLRNRARWDDYQEAANQMFTKTHTSLAPWYLIDARHKRPARIAVMEQLVAVLGKDLDTRPPRVDSAFLKTANKALAPTQSSKAQRKKSQS